MRIFFWDFQDANDIAREWGLFIFNIIVSLYTFSAFMRTWRYYKRCVFELLPLSINMIATFILLMLKLFEKGYQFDLIGHLIEIFTYFLFCYTFALMYARVRAPETRIQVQRIWNIIITFLFIVLLSTCMLVFLGVISRKCNKENEQWPAIGTLIFEFISFIPTAFYGSKILDEISKSSLETDSNDSKDMTSTSVTFGLNSYFQERMKQIRIVLFAYIISLFVRFILSILTIFFLNKLFKCVRIENVSIITSVSGFGQALLVIGEINQLLPHIVIPIAMYLIPLRKLGRSNKSFHLNEKLIDSNDGLSDEDELDFGEDLVQDKVTSLLSSRMSDDSSPRQKRRGKK